MNLVSQILIQVIEAVGGLYIFAVVLRFFLQLVRADFYNPLSQAIVKVTNPLLIPLRRLIPGVFGIDIAALVLALLLQFILGQLLHFIAIQSFANPLSALLLGFLGLINMAIYLGFAAAIVLVVSSFVAPFSTNPIILLAKQLIEPLLHPIQRVIPPLGGLDFSVFFVFLGLGVLQTVVEATAYQLMASPYYVLLAIGV